MAAEPQLRGPAREPRQPQVPAQRDGERGGRSRKRRVNLSLAEIAELPLPAALVDASGAVIARTPEWDGMGPGAVSYPVRSVRLVVRTQPASAQCDAVLSRLLDAIDHAALALSGAQAQRVRMLGGYCDWWPVANRAAGVRRTTSSTLRVRASRRGPPSPSNRWLDPLARYSVPRVRHWSSSSSPPTPSVMTPPRLSASRLTARRFASSGATR